MFIHGKACIRGIAGKYVINHCYSTLYHAIFNVLTSCVFLINLLLILLLQLFI